MDVLLREPGGSITEQAHLPLLMSITGIKLTAKLTAKRRKLGVIYAIRGRKRP